jgi:hypothetical protein
MEFAAARAVLDRFCIMLDCKPASTNKRAFLEPNISAARRRWWFQNNKQTPAWDRPRTVAYLAAYVGIASRPRFAMTGITLDDGRYLYPDRAVMRSLMRARCVQTQHEWFVVTDKGRALIAPMVRIVNGRAELILSTDCRLTNAAERPQSS